MYKKKDIVKEVSDFLNIDKQDVGMVIDAFLLKTNDKLMLGESVSIHAFGKFVFKEMPERMAYDFQKGETNLHRAYKKLEFQPNQRLRQKLYKL